MPRPTRTAPPINDRKLTILLRRQSGVAQVAQLSAAGVTPADLRRMVRRRELVRAAHNVYIDHTGELTALQKAWVAVLRCAPPGAAGLADESALAIAHRNDATTMGTPIHVAVAAHHTVGTIDGVHVHHVRNLDRQLHKHGHPPRLRAEYAALRAASRVTEPWAQVAVLADAVNRKSTTTRALRKALDDLPRLPQRRRIAALVEDLSEGTCSVLEHAYLTMVERPHGLPRPARQGRRVAAGRSEFRDIDYPDLGVVIELDGRAFHEGAEAWDRDHERDLDDSVAGRVTIRLGYRQVMSRACATAEKIASVLRDHGWQGEPLRCPACPTRLTAYRDVV